MRIPRRAARGKTPIAGSLECDCAPINRPLVRRTGYRGRHRRIRRDCGGLGQDGPCADRLAPSRRFAARRKVAASLAPEGCRKSHGEYRHLVLRRFPFGVFDLFDGKTISVIGGAESSPRPCDDSRDIEVRGARRRGRISNKRRRRSSERKKQDQFWGFGLLPSETNVL